MTRGRGATERRARAAHDERGALMHLVIRQINAVTSAMRSSPRWALAATAPNALLSSATTSTSALSLTRAAYALAHEDGAGEARAEGSVGLLGGFTVLRAQLRMVREVTEVPLPALLSHFLRVVLSARTTSTVTHTVLEALATFLQHGLFREDSIGLVRAVQDVAHAASHCRFEPSDAGKDEVVLLAILDVMEQLVCGHVHAADGTPGAPLVDLLGDQNICEMMETCLSMCCQTRLSTALRRSAEHRTLRMMRELFARLTTLPLDADPAYVDDVAAQEPELATLTADQVGEDAEHRMRMATPDPKSLHIPAANIPAEGDAGAEGDTEAEGDAEAEGADAEAEGADAGAEGADAGAEDAGTEAAARASSRDASAGDGARAAPAAPAVAKSPEVLDDALRSPVDDQEPFGLAALVEVLRVIVSLLDPQSTRHTMTMRTLGLRLLAGLVETHGELIVCFPTLRALLQDSACRYLFQLANSEHQGVVSASLRVLGVLFDELRDHFKLQQELFVLFLLQQLESPVPLVAEPWHAEAPARPAVALPYFRTGATGELRELFVEALSLLLDRASGGDAFVELWRNYDCDVHCADVYEALVHFLCRVIYSQPAQAAPADKGRAALSGLQLVALDQVLCLLARMAERHERAAGEDEAGLAVLLAQRARKSMLAAGAAAFNAKPREGVAFLEREGLVDVSSDAARAESIARFLKASSLVDKRLLGDYLSRPDNLAVLSAFMGLFDFQGIDVAEAMRAVCEAFRFPGEAQQIARITETFSHAYYATKPDGIRSEDAVYVLAYSIIMLNTDLHNPQVTRRMTIADYQRNLRGVNDGADFDAAYLAHVYESIRKREIVMPEEHAGQLGFDYAWKELLRKSRTHHGVVRDAPGAWDRALFQHSWRPIVASIAHAFATMQDEHVLQRVIAACRQVAVLARAYDVPDVFDYMVHHFAHATGLPHSALARDTAASVEHALPDGTTIVVSRLSVHFGTNFKSQLAAVVLFTIANGNPGAIRAGWADVLDVLESLLLNGLLPPSVAGMWDVAHSTRVAIPRTAKKGPALQAPAASGGLLSTLSSYFLSPYADAAEPMDVGEAEVESSLCTLDCLASCKIAELHTALRTVPDAALGAYIDALHARLAPLAEAKPPAEADGAPPAPATYTPTTLFLLEELVESVTRRAAVLAARGPALLAACRALLAEPHRHPAELARAWVAAVRVVGAQAHHGTDVRADVDALLATAAQLPAPLHAELAPAVLGALDAVVRAHADQLATPAAWQQLAQVVTTYAATQRADAARLAFALTRHALRDACTATNYAALVELARELTASTDRALWLAAREARDAHRRTLTEKRERADWEEAAQAATLALLPALAHVHKTLPARLAADGADAWPQYWLPLVAALAQPCVNASRATRQAAVAQLQRVVLAPEMLQTAPRPAAPHLAAVFANILLPLLETLCKPETLRADARAFGEGASVPALRVAVAMLVCRAWVHFQAPLSDGIADDGARQRFVDLWLAVLRLVVPLLREKDAEAVSEQVKNMLLVMHTAQLLHTPGVWDPTWALLDPVDAGLRDMVAGTEARSGADAAAPAADGPVDGPDRAAPTAGAPGASAPPDLS
ncbi:GDP/GTP exchange factor for ARF [Malassezia brasiliensis]|uniref:GDP/GTP exchange factor for ARF n=1 Tax=Malassezia brasiliensis TaxID=1821822 RepID=A0AAF0DTN0_9BASI|nr:GDP/GTP exchange factor for ARF [Malassezia brasiliensis]